MIFLIAVGLIIAGLVIMVLAKNAGHPVLCTVVWWLGLLLMILGALLILTPIMVFITVHLEEALGMHRS